MVSSTQTLAQIKSQEFIGHIKQHFVTIYVINGIQNFVKCFVKSGVHLDLRPDMLFRRPQSKVMFDLK